MRMKIFKDNTGTIINIGDWDYQWSEEPSEILGLNGQPLLKRVANNPLPAGAVETTAEVEIAADGSRRVVEA